MTESGNTYRDAGVDLEAANESVEAYKKLVAGTRIPGVVSDVGGFGALFSLKDAGISGDPLLVTATDGVGTKLRIAHQMNRHDTIGQDLVAMCVNDVVTTGGRPLLFLDYLATGVLDVPQAEAIVSGIARACTEVGCALVGGETAEMPGFYQPGEYDVAGFCVGVVDRSDVLKRENVQRGDVIVGLPSTGFHSNGYSLIRRIVEKSSLNLDAPLPNDSQSLGERLLEPTALYVSAVLNAIKHYNLRAAAHITGGGTTENIPRVIPGDLKPTLTTWQIPDWMQTFCEIGEVPADERLRVFNMGIGMAMIFRADDAERYLADHTDAVQIGTIA